jgi:hypothetical protein
MKYLKMLGLAAVAAMALTAVTAGSASATTLEVTGVTQNKSVSITASIAAGGTVRLSSFGVTVNTCNQSHVAGHTTTAGGSQGTEKAGFTGTRVGGPITSLSFSGCISPVTVHKGGGLAVEHIAGTTNGKVFSHGAEVTVFSVIHNTYINCLTGAGTLIGTITGVKHGHATMHINATLNCAPHVSSAKWEGTYTVTTEGLGVSA